LVDVGICSFPPLPLSASLTSLTTPIDSPSPLSSPLDSYEPRLDSIVLFVRDTSTCVLSLLSTSPSLVLKAGALFLQIGGSCRETMSGDRGWQWV
jgi:hypothetical protein